MHSVNKLSRGEIYSIFYYTGYICILLGLIMLIPIIIALIYNEHQLIIPFVYSTIISLLIGVPLYQYYKNKTELSLKSAMIFAAVIWLIGCALAALPYYLSGQLPYWDSYFEAMSGFTTTGFTMYPNLEAVPYAMQFWRGFTQWLGGIGIIVLVLTILTSPSINIMRMYAAEGRDERITPSIRHTTRIILYIYSLYTAISVVLFILAGMPLFDSVFYTFSALSTGGFALGNESIFFYHNAWIEFVAIVVMIIGGTNFALHYTILKGNWKEYFKDIETKVAYPLLIIGTLIVAGFLYNTSYYGHDMLLALRYSVFQVVSALTTTGLQTAMPAEITQKWTGLGIFVLTILMIIGAGACSTGGGIKWLRIGILVKGAWWQVKQLLVPSKAIISHKIHHVRDLWVTDDILRLTGLFVFVYLLVYLISVIIVLIYYQNVAQVLFEVASALSNVGLADGLVTYSSPVVVKIVFIIDFWVGRLEIWPVLLLFTIIINNDPRKR